MKHRLLDVVVLTHDLPLEQLHSGDIGTIVDVYEPDGVAVEFLDLAGRTRSIEFLKMADVRRATQPELSERERLRAQELHQQG